MSIHIERVIFSAVDEANPLFLPIILTEYCYRAASINGIGQHDDLRLAGYRKFVDGIQF